LIENEGATFKLACTRYSALVHNTQAVNLVVFKRSDSVCFIIVRVSRKSSVDKSRA